MSKITRATQKIFGSTASAAQMAEFGSLAAGAPLTYSGATITPAIVQSLSRYLSGWFTAILGSNSPAIEDMNALFYLMTYQLAYLMQAGVAEWDSATTYYIGSIVNSSGLTYVSLTNDNLNNAVTDTTNWRSSLANVVTINPSTQSPYTLTADDMGKTFLVRSNNAAMRFNLPVAVTNFSFVVKDKDGNFLTNNCTIHLNAAESIEGLSQDYVMSAPWGEWGLICDGTNWFFRSK